MGWWLYLLNPGSQDDLPFVVFTTHRTHPFVIRDHSSAPRLSDRVLLVGDGKGDHDSSERALFFESRFRHRNDNFAPSRLPHYADHTSVVLVTLQ